MARRAKYEVPYLFKKVHEETGYDIKDITAGYDAFIRALKKCINTSDSVHLKDFGTFRQKFFNRTIKKNWLTGGDALIPAHFKTSFLSDSDLKRRAYRTKIRSELKRQEALQYAINAERYVREQNRIAREEKQKEKEVAARITEQESGVES